MKLTEANSLDVLVKENIKELLNTQGYHTYVERLDDFDFYVVDAYNGEYVAVAFMVPKDGCICINPGFIVDMDERGPIFQQLSVVVRHELLHFLLCHEKRFIDYLKKTDPDFERTYKYRQDIHTIANFAMDYDLGNVGYDEYDKEVVRNMTLNGQFIGGLLSEEVKNGQTKLWGAGISRYKGDFELLTGSQFQGWENKSFEEMFQMLREEHEKIQRSRGNEPGKAKTTIHVQREDHSQEYRDIYNQVIQKYGMDSSITDQDLQDLLAKLDAGEDII